MAILTKYLFLFIFLSSSLAAKDLDFTELISYNKLNTDFVMEIHQTSFFSDLNTSSVDSLVVYKKNDFIKILYKQSQYQVLLKDKVYLYDQSNDVLIINNEDNVSFLNFEKLLLSLQNKHITSKENDLYNFSLESFPGVFELRIADKYIKYLKYIEGKNYTLYKITEIKNKPLDIKIFDIKTTANTNIIETGD